MKMTIIVPFLVLFLGCKDERPAPPLPLRVAALMGTVAIKSTGQDMSQVSLTVMINPSSDAATYHMKGPKAGETLMVPASAFSCDGNRFDPRARVIHAVFIHADGWEAHAWIIEP